MSNPDNLVGERIVAEHIPVDEPFHELHSHALEGERKATVGAPVEPFHVV